VSAAHPLLDAGYLDDVPAVLAAAGEVFRVFDQQDSGCVSFGVRIAAQRWFVKTATTSAAAASLRQAVRVHESLRHPAVVAPVHALATGPQRWPALVYPWVDGEVLYHATVAPDGTPTATSRSDPASPMARFRALPVDEVRAAVDVVLDAHLAVDAAGLVAVDLYDGCFVYDFAARSMRLIDLDEYRPGPFTTSGRLPGSARFLAPEELAAGRRVDRRTTVFRLGRVVRLLLDARDDEDAWRGTETELAVVGRASRADPAQRYPDVADMVAAWRGAR
jgi:hypothetical protein